MIPAIHPRGTRVGGLIRYLYGPGRCEAHRNPHLIAAWTGAGPLATLEPSIGGTRRRDFRPLVDLLEQPVRAGVRPPSKTVWHCSIRAHRTDRLLTDGQWAHIAGEVLAGVGLAPHGDDQAVRWAAVRHSDDHIHIVATLVRQDRRTAWAWQDRPRSQATRRDLEERYGLYRAAPPDRTATKRAHRIETAKARRTGRPEAARDQLRREVRYAAAAAGSSDEFFTLLRRAGLLLRLRHSSIDPTQITGYAVALTEVTTAAGDPVFYSGGRLGTDLTLPKLRPRWGQTRTGTPTPPPGEQARLYQQAAERIRAATADINRLADTDPVAASAAGYAAADTLTVIARIVEGDRSGPLHRAAEAVDRAAREPYGRQPPRTPRVQQLRAMSRLLALAGQLSDDKTLFVALHLLMDLSLLADSLAQLRETQQRLNQARAARTAAQLLRSTRPTGPPTAATPPTVPPTRQRYHPRSTRRQGTSRAR